MGAGGRRVFLATGLMDKWGLANRGVGKEDFWPREHECPEAREKVSLETWEKFAPVET